MDELEQKRILAKFAEIASIHPGTAAEYLEDEINRGNADDWAAAVIGSGCPADPTEMIKVAGQCLNRQIEELRDPAGR